MTARVAIALSLLLALLLASAADAQRRQRPGQQRAAAGRAAAAEKGPETVQLDFKDADLQVVIETIARTTGKNFIYDDKVRGKVTIVSPSPVTVDQAYAVFESVLKVKGFTVITGPAGVLQIIPVREAKESNVEIIQDDRPSPNRDQFVTRLIPLRYIDAEAITNTIKPLVSKDASMVAYGPTNTIILTDTGANIRRLLRILEAIDVETFKEELAVIKIEHADAATLGDQISEIYGAEISSDSASRSSTAARRARSSRRNRRSSGADSAAVEPAKRGKVRLITDSRTNSLIVLAARGQLDDIRQLIRTLDVPVRGQGKIHVYYLRHADAEELSQTLNGLLTGQARTGRTSRAGRTGGDAAAPQAVRAAVTALSEGIQINADPGTNALVIQADKEGYETLVEVIEQLDIERPQVLVEALIMEVQVGKLNEFGMNVGIELNKAFNLVLVSAANGAPLAGGPAGIPAATTNTIANFSYQSGDTTIQAIMRASQGNAFTNIVAAPHLLTSDNEEAEIQVGQNIPIITNRLETATGNPNASTSVSVERQDVGVTLRVTPQISEGNQVRLAVFQENTTIAASEAGDVEEVGVTLSKRQIENTLVVPDSQTVVIGGLLLEEYIDQIDKTPWLGDVPVLGWLFKEQSKTIRKTNLLIFLTPHIVRSAADLEYEAIRKRRELEERLGGGYLASGRASDSARARTKNPAKAVLRTQAKRYPLARMREIEAERERSIAELKAAEARGSVPDVYLVTAGAFYDEDQAAEKLTILIDRGYDGTLVAREEDGVVLFELRIGPYESLRDAELAAEVLNEAFGLSTGVLMVPGQALEPAVMPFQEAP